MSYTALYRKFRPTKFPDVKGQDHIVTTLKNQIRADRVGHAYLFCGTRGTGKTTVAKIFAKAVNCEHPVDGSPCGECASCRAISSGASMNVIEIDGASNNGVDNIREIREEVSYSPTEGKYKVYIIDEAHMITPAAFNALLKTLEEPPSYVIFILATTDVHKVPVTILSRCQRYDFRRITADTIMARMKELMVAEQVEAEDRALAYIAKAADGSLRDALSLLDQCIAFYLGEKLTYDHVLEVLGAVDIDVFSELFRQICARNLTKVISGIEKVILQGRELSQFTTDFIWYLRNLLMLQSGDGMEELVDVSSENLVRMREEASLCDSETLMRYIRVLSDLSGQLRYSTQKRVLVEIALIRLCRPAMEQDYSSLLQRVSQLEQRMEKGIPVAAQPVREAGEASVTRPKTLLPEALSEDVQQFVKRFQEFRKKLGGMQAQQLKGAACRELPDRLGAEIILSRELPVDEQALAQDLERLVEKEMQVRMSIKVHTPHSDPRPEEAVLDLSGLIDMEIEVDSE
ncbi:MAG: DNA polymerase III subunit gamma/tau [Lachnospiraceae bacterium]|nr:DNA polymerase III subunit gamma/tau [Lachnospiraceae bacterium]